MIQAFHLIISLEHSTREINKTVKLLGNIFLLTEVYKFDYIVTNCTCKQIFMAVSKTFAASGKVVLAMGLNLQPHA